MNFAFITKSVAYFDNQIDPMIPEWWAQETLAILYEEMFMGTMVNRDYESYFNKFGDTVNTRRPRELEAIRKAKGDAVTTQDIIADNVQIKLDQWVHTSIIIDDLDEVMSMKDLSRMYAQPAAKALARYVDRIVLGQYPRFLGNSAGYLNGITSSNAKDVLLDLRKVMNDNKAYESGRNVVLSNATETDLLRPEWFVSADKRGDTEGLRNAIIGHKFGFDFMRSNNMATVATGNTTRTFQINNASGYAKGTTALTVDTGSGEITVGTWVEIAGAPYRVTARTGTAPTTAITLASGLKAAVADNVAITVYTPGAVNNASGYAAGWTKEIVVDGFTVAPQVGQFVTFGSVATPYTIIKVNGTTGITLDRALAAALTDNDAVNIGPAGSYNLTLNRDAITLAIRPLEPVRGGAGALSYTAQDPGNGLTVRVTISYDPVYQKHRWTWDFLAGIEVLDTNLGAVLLG